MMDHVRSKGVNASENRLARLCDRTFLTMWSFSNPYKRPGQELCDLLVVFGNDIVLFSDKSCAFRETGDLQLAWSRWCRNAVIESRKEVIAAERWIREHPDRVYVNANCKAQLPIPFPEGDDVRFHKVAVAHGSLRRCKAQMGGSGSLLLNPSPGTFDLPFVVSLLDSKHHFVHVLDDVTLDIVLQEIDTIADFVRYLRNKEQLFVEQSLLVPTHEEDLLAAHLQTRASDPVGGFGLAMGQKLQVATGLWEHLRQRPEHIEKKKQDGISQVWDKIIDVVTQDALENKLLIGQTDLASTEAGLRMMASECRFARRVLSIALVDLIKNAPTNSIVRRLVRPETKPWATRTAYVFFTFPMASSSCDDDRKARAVHMYMYCLAIAGKYREYPHVLGIATEAGLANGGRSHDICLIRINEWTAEWEARARSAHEELDVMREDRLQWWRLKSDEFPKAEPAIEPGLSREECRAMWGKVGPNATCPCGSGKKFKKCHGQR